MDLAQGIFTLVGVLVGVGASFLVTERAHQHQRTLQGESIKRQTYVDFASALDEWRVIVLRLHAKTEDFLAAPDLGVSRQISAELTALRSNQTKAMRAWRQLQLNADENVIEAGAAAIEAVFDLPPVNPDEWKQNPQRIQDDIKALQAKDDEIEELTSEFLDVCRDDLGLDQILEERS